MISVIIRSKDEADRLRLTLASLRRQSVGHEVIVVNDGSSDHTQAMLNAAAEHQAITIVRHAAPKGRSPASNAGARIARGEVLLFMDGDTLAAPDLLSRHAALHEAEPRAMGRGDVANLRCTRMLLDPETGAPQPEHSETLSRRPAAEIERMRVTMAQVLDDFSAIDRRAERGVYPGVGPRRLAELEMQALRDHPDCPVGWAAATGSNFSVKRDAFVAVGGFDEQLDLNAHRELALRMQKAGGRVRALADARSYHLTHRTGWRDPVKQTDWETLFLAAHPEPAVALQIVFWAGFSQARTLAPEFQIPDLPALQAAAESGVSYDAARGQLMAPALGDAFWRRDARPKPSPAETASANSAMSASPL